MAWGVKRALVAGVAAAALLEGEAISVRTASQSRSSSDSYSFGDFVSDFGRSYEEGSEEFLQRAATFQRSLAHVAATNARNEKEGRQWRAGIHKFMDWTVNERRALNGYKPDRTVARSSVVALLGLRGSQRMNSTGYAEAVGGSGGLSASAGPAIRDQGNCGSCWAISAAEAVEAQMLAKGIGGGQKVAAQALVDCVPNPQHCGGSGGCEGATGELAYAWMRDHGIPLEKDLPYTARTETCPHPSGLWAATPRIRAGGWDQLPSNQAQPLMQALVEKGPVVVAVDGNNWFNYESGIFDDCSKDALLGHAVLAKGFGVADGSKYWLIQNSWGSDWGESGHIRLIRHDDEDSWCGTDNKPQDGVGCDGGPSEVTVCGTCGLLYDPIVPTDVTMENGA